MKVDVVILRSAEIDLKELRSYLLRNFSAQAWNDSYGKLKDTIGHLAMSPYAGSVPTEIEKLHLNQYGQAVSGLNRIIYELRGEKIYIHIIADTRKNLPDLLVKRLMRVDR
ncbi:plasmid stabilization protein [Pseudomonas agarici]|uniref:Plasmid stabilization protein n=1 Tax=Pseudomonas agarici TaxID=46677 RepID=A0A0X1T3G6_PSEAA|nr:type II toxin-antitoxin system RelE/ParE family toxin [Pseudomonas agarici]AMB86605.1 plasmid stabilization protein [Pseudomonas agarici]NWB92411.1 type II toxin-antitoxin system RelE/ParE family toxin [Pseudomonas agarici]NWC11537.1 type II toxin-antitoxin system RelE/ParE family toxin [Pseudomonas agarici]SEL64121.1 hypothetical protein SAMN05216604_12572 [Pseudomonas agarici]